METTRAAAKPRVRHGQLEGARIMDLGGGNWAILNIVGPLLLAAVLLWALLRNRKSRRSESETEQATRDLYREEEDKRRTGDDARS
jgi:hypothetical protein